jgi:hypothetical protein
MPLLRLTNIVGAHLVQIVPAAHGHRLDRQVASQPTCLRNSIETGSSV